MFPCICILLQYDTCLVSARAHQRKDGNSSKAINYVLYTVGDSTNFVLSEGKSSNLEETWNRCYIFMALKTRNHHLIYDSARAEYVGRTVMLSNEVCKQKCSFQHECEELLGIAVWRRLRVGQKQMYMLNVTVHICSNKSFKR